MRILHLRLKNLNSLVGEWSIDFTHPAYEDTGIFAIIGPTGAGKSTLLDAICLALYGKTPRLDKISKNTNEIMARHTGECSAEVTFETACGKYRCSWAQRRAHKKAGGDLQAAQREIVEALTHTILESNLSKVDAKIEEITGMDYQRFTRSMLLAQGSFDVFLKASPSERAPILEQITGTEVYSKISIGVYERNKKENQKLEALQNELAAIKLLTPEDDKDHTAEYHAKAQERACLESQLQCLHAHKTWREEVDRLALHQKDLEARWQAHLSEAHAALPDLQRLELALNALNFEGDFRELEGLKRRQNEHLEGLKKASAEKRAVTAALSGTGATLANYQQSFEALQAEHKRTQEVGKCVRELDNAAHREGQKLDLLALQLAAVAAKTAMHSKELAGLQRRHESHQNDLRTIHTHCEAYANDACLLEEFSALQDGIKRLKAKRGQITAKHTQHAAALKGLDGAKCQLASHSHAFEQSKADLEGALSSLKALEDHHARIDEGRDALQWGLEKDALVHQEKFYGLLASALERDQQCTQQQIALLEAQLAFNSRLQDCHQREICHRREIVALDQKIEALLGQQSLQNRLQSFDEERAQLSDNLPCPLCGALEHPYAHGNIPNLREVDALLITAKQESKALGKYTQDVAKELAQLEIEIQNCALRMESAVQLAQQLKKEILVCAKELQHPHIALISLHEVSNRHAACIKQVATFKQKHEAYLMNSQNKESAQNLYNQAFNKHSAIAQQRDELLAAHSQRVSQVDYLQQESTLLEQELQELECTLLDSLCRYGIYNLAAANLDVILEELAQRLICWKQQQSAKAQLESTLQKALMQITLQQGHLERTESALRDLTEEKEQCSAKVAELHHKRQQLYGAKDPEHEDIRLNGLVENSRVHLQKLKEESIRMHQQLGSLEVISQELTNTTQEGAVRLQREEKIFSANILGVGFDNLAAYQQAALAHEERSRLTLRKNTLEKSKAELLAEKKVAEKRMEELHQKPQTAETLPDILQQVQELAAHLDAVKERTLLLKTILAENARKQTGASALREKLALQTKESNTWQGLSSLIGAADGKKFRDFAQKMTLEMMIAHANRQLVKMSDRYLLKQAKGSPLELDVVDNYQGGEERSVKNLSGGEAFIVSLSLALGLSQMSSSKVRVDTLFLDEGFGTLDEHALEVALDALSELHHEGKVIGLISHVPVVKERIPTQIRVQPLSGGRSRIEGPGCREIK